MTLTQVDQVVSVHGLKLHYRETQLADIGCPTLVIAGGSTSHVPQDLLARAAELIPDARLVTLEGAGHTVHRTQPERFVAEVRAFLGAVAPGK
jgi:esterase